MAQHDYNIANQGFSSFRSDLNNALSAVQTCNSGTSRPTGAVAGQIWLDTTSATSPTLKYYDGADDISLATIDHTANTVNWLDSNVSVTGLTTTATGTVITLSDTANTSTVNLIIDNQKEVRFRETTANGTNYIGLKAPASVSADLTYTLPATDGTAGQFLSTNGSGVLSFATAGLTGATSTATGTVLTLSDTAITTTQNLIIDNDKEVRFREATANGTNYVSLSAPATLASDLTLTLPSADGTSGQVLQTNGSGVLSFSSPSSDFVKLATGTISSSTASISFDGYFTSTYNIYKFFWYDCRPVTNNGSTFSIRFRRSNADVTSSNYKSMIGAGSISNVSAENFTGGGRWNGTSMQINNTTWWISDTNYNFCGDVTFYNPLGTSLYKTITFNTMGEYEDSYWYGGSGSGTLKDSTSALSGFTFLMNSSNISTGKFVLYGLKI
jgi:hypothetical protein